MPSDRDERGDADVGDRATRRFVARRSVTRRSATL
jgi:hypothetical protein